MITLKFAEKCLEDYPANLARIDALTWDYKRKPTDKLEREVKGLYAMTKPLQKMINNLSDGQADNGVAKDMLTVLGLCYFGRNPVSAILETTGWSRANFFRKKNRLIERARDYLANYSDHSEQLHDEEMKQMK